MDKLEGKYGESVRQFARACDYLPGGVNSPVRAFGGVDMPPLFIDSAKGSKVRDIDGNEYIDYVGSWGPMILGHAHPAVIEAVAKQAASSAGVPDSVAAETIVVEYNDIEAVRAAFELYKDKIAAVLIEPVAANMGVVVPGGGYLRGLRDICDDNDALLIFDEVITGFRVAFGGAQELYGTHADITCLGKIIGGGLPIGAFGGRGEIMDMLSPLGPVYQAGTLSGNPLATAAANATLEILAKGDCYGRLEASASALQEGLSGAAERAGAAVTINRVGSIMSCFFTDGAVKNFADVQATDIGRFKKFFSEMLGRGIYLAPSAYEAMFVSLAHSAEDIERTVAAAEESFGKIKVS